MRHVKRPESIAERGDITPHGRWPVFRNGLRNAPCTSAPTAPLPCAATLASPDGSVLQHPLVSFGAVPLQRSVRCQRELRLGPRGALLAGEENHQRAERDQHRERRQRHLETTVESSITPGPQKPPRFPTAAISAIPAAAAVPLRKAVGSARKTGIAERMPAAAEQHVAEREDPGPEAKDGVAEVESSSSWSCAKLTFTRSRYATT
jgi:hypothetical protein